VDGDVNGGVPRALDRFVAVAVNVNDHVEVNVHEVP
jgi:hypothetical protein